MILKLHQLGASLKNPVTVLSAVRAVSPQNNVCVRFKTTKEVPYPKLDVFAQKAASQPGKGKIYDKKPFKVNLEAGKTYAWCLCGWSKTQPFCDSTHKNPLMKIKLKPLVWKCEKSGEYWLCNCKQTNQRPFCDGTHRSADVQAAIKS